MWQHCWRTSWKAMCFHHRMWSVLWWTAKSPSNTPSSSLSVSYQSTPVFVCWLSRSYTPITRKLLPVAWFQRSPCKKVTESISIYTSFFVKCSYDSMCGCS